MGRLEDRGCLLVRLDGVGAILSDPCVAVGRSGGVAQRTHEQCGAHEGADGQPRRHGAHPSERREDARSGDTDAGVDGSDGEGPTGMAECDHRAPGRDPQSEGQRERDPGSDGPAGHDGGSIGQCTEQHVAEPDGEQPVGGSEATHDDHGATDRGSECELALDLVGVGGQEIDAGTVDDREDGSDEESGGLELAEGSERRRRRDDGTHDGQGAGPQTDLDRPPARERGQFVHSGAGERPAQQLDAWELDQCHPDGHDRSGQQRHHHGLDGDLRAAPDDQGQHPERAGGEHRVVDHEAPELASGNQNPSERLLDRPGNRGDGEEHGRCSVDPVDPQRDRERDDRDETECDPLGLEQRAADTGVEPVQDGERITDPAGLDGVDGHQHTQQQAERPETGRPQFPQRDERQQQTRRRNDELRHHRGDRPTAHRQ